MDAVFGQENFRSEITWRRVWRWTRKRMQKAYEQGLVVQQRPGAVPRLKRYLDEMKGTPVDTIWGRCKASNRLNPGSASAIPTQKPLVLLNRIIQASSDINDMVMDPFCGCATTCVSADKLNRQWIGIDISHKASELVNMRLQSELGDLYHSRLVAVRTDVPKRTDLGELPDYRTYKHILFGKQEGVCGGCRSAFPFRNFTIDHIVPQTKGGTNHQDNLQLLCGACNSLKGDRPQAYLVARLKGLAAP